MKNENFYLTVGGPGAGKTTFIKNQVSKALAHGYEKEEIDIRSLTKAAAHQAAGKVDLPEWRIGTRHSACFRALGLSKDDVAESKIHKFNEATGRSVSCTTPQDMDDPKPIEQKIAAKTMGDDFLMARMNLYRARQKPMPDSHTQRFADQWFKWMDDQNLTDFTGMIERCVDEVDTMPGRPRIMFVDEVQDDNALGLALTEKWGQHADRVIMVGDPIQCLYQWAGADPTRLEDMVPTQNRRMLQRSYRVPRDVLEWAHNRVPSQIEHWGLQDFEPRDEDGDDYVKTIPGTATDPGSVIDQMRAVVANGQDAMILATSNYMLNQTIEQLRALGEPFSNRWRTKRSDWNPLAPRRTAKALDFLEGDQRDIAKMRWMADLRADVLRRGVKTGLKKGTIETPTDFDGWVGLFASEEHAIKALGHRDLDWLIAHVEGPKRLGLEYIQRVISSKGLTGLRERPRLTVGTIHSVKGGEADVVALYPDVAPSVDKALATGSRVAADQRLALQRMMFVAATRARHGLLLVAQHSRKRPLYRPW